MTAVPELPLTCGKPTLSASLDPFTTLLLGGNGLLVFSSSGSCPRFSESFFWFGWVSGPGLSSTKYLSTWSFKRSVSLRLFLDLLCDALAAASPLGLAATSPCRSSSLVFARLHFWKDLRSLFFPWTGMPQSNHLRSQVFASLPVWSFKCSVLLDFFKNTKMESGEPVLFAWHMAGRVQFTWMHIFSKNQKASQVGCWQQAVWQDCTVWNPSRSCKWWSSHDLKCPPSRIVPGSHLDLVQFASGKGKTKNNSQFFKAVDNKTSLLLPRWIQSTEVMWETGYRAARQGLPGIQPWP